MSTVCFLFPWLNKTGQFYLLYLLLGLLGIWTFPVDQYGMGTDQVSWMLYSFLNTKCQNSKTMQISMQCTNVITSLSQSYLPHVPELAFCTIIVCVYNNNRLLWSFANYTNILFNLIRWENLQMTHSLHSNSPTERWTARAYLLSVSDQTCRLCTVRTPSMLRKVLTIAVWSRCCGKPSIRTRVASLKTESVVTRTTKENRKVQAGSTSFKPGWKHVQQSTTKITTLLSICQLTLTTYDCPCWGWYIGVFQWKAWHLIWDYMYV